MAKQLKKKHLWLNVRIAEDASYIEARESKPAETGSLLFFLFGPIACFLLSALIPSRPNSILPDLLILLAVVGWLIGFAILCLYRPPRVLRLYPVEQVAHVSRQFFIIRFPGKWHDLAGSDLLVNKTPLIATQEQLSMTKIAFVILLFLLGPIGMIIGLLSSRALDNKINLPTYALTCSGQNGLPLAVMIKRADCERIINYYKQAAHISP